MNTPKKFWRLHYDSEESLKTMLSEGKLLSPKHRFIGGRYNPDNFISELIRLGDGIILARFDIDNSVGEAVAIGIVQNEKPATLVAWKPVTFLLHPNPQGGIAMWRKEACFRFDDIPAKRYQLTNIFAKHFP